MTTFLLCLSAPMQSRSVRVYYSNLTSALMEVLYQTGDLFTCFELQHLTPDCRIGGVSSDTPCQGKSTPKYPLLRALSLEGLIHFNVA